MRDVRRGWLLALCAVICALGCGEQVIVGPVQQAGDPYADSATLDNPSHSGVTADGGSHAGDAALPEPSPSEPGVDPTVEPTAQPTVEPTVEPDGVVVDCTADSDCDDQDPCTADMCARGGCVYNPQTGTPCDDSDGCTQSDSCVEGVCSGVPLDCDDNNPCTVDNCDGIKCYSELVPSDECALEVTVTAPKRGAHLSGNGVVVISGAVVSNGAELVSLTLDGVPIEVAADNTFAVEYQASIGINIFQLKATDALEQYAEVVQSCVYATHYHPAGSPGNLTILPHASGLFLDEMAFDDDDTSDLDDLATMTRAIIVGFDVNSVIPDPLFAEGDEPSWGWCTWETEVSNVSYDVGEVDLIPTSGGLYLSASLMNFEAKLHAVAGFCPDAEGWVYADEITIVGQLSLDVTASKALEVLLDWVSVEIINVELDITGGSASLFNWLIDWFEDDLGEAIEDNLQSYIPDQVLPLIQSLLSQLSDYEIEFEVPAVDGGGLLVALKVLPNSLLFNSQGGELGLDIGVAANPVVGMADPGSLARGNCAGLNGVGGEALTGSCVGYCDVKSPNDCWCDETCGSLGDCCDDVCVSCGYCDGATGGGCAESGCDTIAAEGCWCDSVCVSAGDCCDDACTACGHCDADPAGGISGLPHTSQVEGFVNEDMINQALFAVWRGGYTQLTLPTFSGELISEALEDVDVEQISVTLDGALPPIATSCTPTGDIEIQVGDMRVQAEFLLSGESASFDLYASVRVPLGFEVVEVPGGQNEFGVVFEGVDQLDAQVLSAEGMGSTFDILIDAILTEAVVNTFLKDLVANLVTSYPIPQIDVWMWVPGIPVGTSVTFEPDLIEMKGGELMCGGHVISN